MLRIGIYTDFEYVIDNQKRLSVKIASFFILLELFYLDFVIKGEFHLEERLQKFLARAGVASRRSAEKLITEGKIRVNGVIIKELGTKVDPFKDKISYNGKMVKLERKKVYYMLNKPKGYISTVKDDKGRKTVVDILSDVEERIFPIGRLDYNTEGLLLLTNDGDFMNKLLHPKYEIGKTYVAKIDGIINLDDLHKLADGVKLEDGKTAPADVYLDSINKTLKESRVEITIYEGKNRQVRRMFKALGYEVKALKRIAFAGLTLNKLKRGEYRKLTDNELLRLRKKIGDK